MGQQQNNRNNQPHQGHSSFSQLSARITRQLQTINLRNILVGVARPIFLPLVLGSLLAYLGQVHQIFELLTHFRLQYCLGALFALLLYVWTKRRIEILACLFCVVLNAAMLLPWYLPATDVTNTDADLRVMVANVLTSNDRYDDFVQSVQQTQPDVLVVMELNDEWQKQLQKFAATLPHKFEYPRQDNFGIAIYSRYPLEQTVIQRWADSIYTVPSLTADITLNQKMIHLVATHPLPPLKPFYFKNRNQHMIDMANYIQQNTDKPGERTVLMGDLNMSMWSPYYQKFIRSTGLVNTRQGFGIQPTWPTDAPLLQIPIDHCLVSRNIQIVRNRIIDAQGSDHHSIVADLKI